jgi:hypothetical protein
MAAERNPVLPAFAGFNGGRLFPAQRRRLTAAAQLGDGPRHQLEKACLAAGTGARERRFEVRAAERCAVSQPSLSKAIGLLERELGGRLFLRGRKTCELTALGLLLQPQFVAIERNIRRTHEMSAAWRRGRASRLLWRRPAAGSRRPRRSGANDDQEQRVAPERRG